MEGQQTIVLKNLPITTRNYTVVDTATGKPVDNTTYSLTIAPHVIEKLYELKRINEEKKQQAAFRQQYAQESLTTAYTPQDNSVFTPLTTNEYIDVRDVNSSYTEYQEQTEGMTEEYNQAPRVETMQADGILGRVTARAPEQEYKEITLDKPAEPELDYITAETYQQTSNYEYEMPPVADNSTFNPSDNSVFTPSDNSTFNPSSAPSYNEGSAISMNSPYTGYMEEDSRAERAPKAKKERKKRADYIELSPDEVKSGKGVAWLAYIIFFLPLILKGRNRFVRLHANEGLDLNIAEIIGAGLMAPFFLMKDLAGITEMAVYGAAILGAVILVACAITIIPVMIGSMCGAQFQIPWLLRKRLIRVNRD